MGAIKGGFDRTALFEKAEKGFDRLFGYNRQLFETFGYCNTMKNGNISEQLNMQERQISDERRNTNTQTKLTENEQDNSMTDIQSVNQENIKIINSLSISLIWAYPLH
jgi:hypothetical protein